MIRQTCSQNFSLKSEQMREQQQLRHLLDYFDNSKTVCDTKGDPSVMDHHTTPFNLTSMFTTVN